MTGNQSCNDDDRGEPFTARGEGRERKSERARKRDESTRWDLATTSLRKSFSEPRKCRKPPWFNLYKTFFRKRCVQCMCVAGRLGSQVSWSQVSKTWVPSSCPSALLEFQWRWLTRDYLLWKIRGSKNEHGDRGSGWAMGKVCVCLSVCADLTYIRRYDLLELRTWRWTRKWEGAREKAHDMCH